MRLRAFIVLASYFALAMCLGAQTVNLTAANTQTLAGKTFTGKLCVIPTNNGGVPISFQYGNGGQGILSQVCFNVTQGALQTGVTVPDTYLTNPKNLCLYAQLIDPTQPTAKQIVGTYPCLQPASSGQSWCSTSAGVTTCDLDNYAPIETALVVQQTGIQGPAGTVQIGTVTTGAPGSSAAVTNSGTGSAAILNFQIPGGASGIAGSTDVSTLAGADFGAKLSACIAALNSTYGGVCDGRAFNGSAQSMAASVTISTPNAVIYLPCSTITTAQQIVVPAGVRNVTIHGCGYQGGSNASGTQGASVLNFTGSASAIQVGDTTYAQDTKGFHIDNVNLVTASGGSAAVGLAFYRTQEIDARNLYLNGNAATGQTGVYLDGTGDYTGGTFDSDTINGFGSGLTMTGHVSGSVVGDYSNAGTFSRLHIVCPTSGGNPISGTYGVNLLGGDGNTWSGGDIENCATMFHLGANAVNNTVDGLRNENSTIQYQADSGSSFNAVFTGGTFFTGKLIDGGSRNSFWDAFHRTANGMNGDWYASQQDATVTNHLRLGIGAGNVRGLQWESQVDEGTTASQYNWLWGLSDGASGQSNWMFQDSINNVMRLQLQQFNTAGGAAGTAVNAAGTGNVCFNCSANSGTGGVAFSSGGASPSTVATVDASGNQTLFGYARFFDPNAAAEAWRLNCANQASCNIDSWASGSPVHHFRLYGGAGSDIDSEGTSTVSVNGSTNSGTGGFTVYGGGASPLKWFVISGLSTIQFPGLAASSGHYCLQVDNSGWLTNTGSACGTGNGNGNGTVTQIAVTVPGDESVSPASITAMGTFAITRNSQAANLFLAAPCSGSAAPAYRVICAADLPAATPATQGAVILPTGASGNTLGTAAMQPTSAFDAAGAASTAQSTAEAASDPAGSASTALTTAESYAVHKTNTLGCIDGYDHLPCVVYEMGLTSQSTVTGSYATAYTTPAAGVYRISGNVYATTQSTTAYTVTVMVKEAQTGSVTSHGLGVDSATIGTSESWNNTTAIVQNLNSGVNIAWETSGSGTNTSGVWNFDLIIERIK
jgi:hypothetical protein